MVECFYCLNRDRVRKRVIEREAEVIGKMLVLPVVGWLP
jgi:hypothetical protein